MIEVIINIIFHFFLITAQPLLKLFFGKFQEKWVGSDPVNSSGQMNSQFNHCTPGTVQIQPNVLEELKLKVRYFKNKQMLDR